MLAHLNNINWSVPRGSSITISENMYMELLCAGRVIWIITERLLGRVLRSTEPYRLNWQTPNNEDCNGEVCRGELNYLGSNVVEAVVKSILCES